MSGLVTKADLCAAAAAVLADPTIGVAARAAELAGLGVPYEWAGEERLDAGGLPIGYTTPVATWDQLPSLAALTSAALPAGAVVSPGLVEPPTRSRSTGYRATWRLVVGVYDRGEDYADTQARCGRWAALVRFTVLRSVNLAGFASDVLWAGEEYAELPERSSARTLAGCAVAFDVTVQDVLGVPTSDPVVTTPVVTTTVR